MTDPSLSHCSREPLRRRWGRRPIAVAVVVALAAGLPLLSNAKAQAAVGYYVSSTVPAGIYPYGEAVDPSTQDLYVTDASADALLVIDESGDTNNGKIISTVTVGSTPYGDAVDPSTHTVYVANYQSNTVSVIDESGDAHNGTVTHTIAVGTEPHGIVVDPTTHNVYVANYSSNTVSVIDESGDAQDGTVTHTIPVGEEPYGVAVDPSNHHVYVANSGSGDALSVIDGSTDAHADTVIATINVGSSPLDVAVDTSTHNVYVTGFNLTMRVIDESGDANNGKVTATFKLANHPDGVAVDQSTHNVYVVDVYDNSVLVFDESGDAQTGTLLATVYFSPGSDSTTTGVAVNPITHDVYVCNDVYVTGQSYGTISVISSRVVPAVTRITPPSGPIAGATTVTITGTGFTGATKVTFGTVAATSFNVVSDTEITAVAPGQSSGIHNVYVTTPATTSLSVAADHYNYGAAITAISPISGPVTGGTTVTIAGTGFTGATKVDFGALAATSYTVVSDSEITATSPAQADSVHQIFVTAPAGATPAVPADRFIYGAGITAISPTSGEPGGGSTVTITGVGFTGATKVDFGTVPATSFKVISATEITAVSPNQTDTNGLGPHNIYVTVPSGTSPSVPADMFTYVYTP